MTQPRNRTLQIRRFGDADGLELLDTVLPTTGRREVRVRARPSSIEYNDVTIRRHLHAQTMCLRPPFVMGYDVVGKIDQLGDLPAIGAIRPRVASGSRSMR
jgi:NADPH:quinone reductase-like Zn-dependent oxidoreductase